MKKTGIIHRVLSLILSVLLLAIPVSANSISEEDMSVSRGCHSLDAQVPMLAHSEEEITNVYSAILYDYTNDTLLYAYNPDVQYPPASLVKILTALIIIEQGNMKDEVTVRQDILDTLSESSLGIDLQAGETIKMEDLLYAILVESANDAAAVAADHISGSQENFVREMNAYAQAFGCTNTTITNVHGLHDESQVSTARDLARILANASKNEYFMEIFGTTRYTIPATNKSEARQLSSNNFLMNGESMRIYLDSRVTGGRSGVMTNGARNLAVTAEKNDTKLISIVMGSHSTLAPDGYSVSTFGSFLETSKLLDMGFQGQRSVQLFYDGQVLKQYSVVDGDSYLSTGVHDAVVVTLPSGVSYDDLSYLYSEDNAIIRAPVAKDDLITTVQVWYDGICFGQANLYAMHDVKIKEVIETQEVQEKDSSGIPSILIVVAVIVGLLFILLFGRRLIFRIIRRSQIRRHRKNRRRSR